MNTLTYNEVLAAAKLLRKHGKTAAELVNEHIQYLQTTEEFKEMTEQEKYNYWHENFNFSKHEGRWPTLADFKRAVLQLGLNYKSKNS
ncbi:MAG TPA: hypothetical protein VGW78_07655 [Candidatus Babeliales bacterium]|jgi:hypothetical protein|nr:hypothetical protein [Candidatus Babeliales bacterium]